MEEEPITKRSRNREVVALPGLEANLKAMPKKGQDRRVRNEALLFQRSACKQREEQNGEKRQEGGGSKYWRSFQRNDPLKKGSEKWKLNL